MEHWLQGYCRHWNTNLIFAEMICYLLDTEQLDRVLAVSLSESPDVSLQMGTSLSQPLCVSP